MGISRSQLSFGSLLRVLYMWTNLTFTYMPAALLEIARMPCELDSPNYHKLRRWMCMRDLPHEGVFTQEDSCTGSNEGPWLYTTPIGSVATKLSALSYTNALNHSTSTSPEIALWCECLLGSKAERELGWKGAPSGKHEWNRHSLLLYDV